jgi:flagellar biosynthetic protein FlhB
MAFGDDAERTEAATPHRREQAREEGQAVRSREVVVTAVFLSNVLFLTMAGASLYEQMLGLTRDTLLSLSALEVSLSGVHQLYTYYLGRLATMLAPLFLATFVLTLGCHLFQTGWLFSLNSLAPQWSHINPARGLQRLVSMQGLSELIKSLLKIGIIGYVAYTGILAEVEHVLRLSAYDIPEIVQYIGNSFLRLCVRISYVVLLIAALDYGWQRWQFEKSLRMSKQEIKEESKAQDGDPQIKARVRSMMREMARKRMMQEVPRATVVVTNPTHLAIALVYRRDEMAAPQVVAKGAGYVAERIKAIAQEHDIPLVENKPIAQQLFKTVEIGQAIPEGLYKAVAEILAYVYRLQQRGA